MSKVTGGYREFSERIPKVADVARNNITKWRLHVLEPLSETEFRRGDNQKTRSPFSFRYLSLFFLRNTMIRAAARRGILIRPQHSAITTATTSTTTVGVVRPCSVVAHHRDGAIVNRSRRRQQQYQPRQGNAYAVRFTSATRNFSGSIGAGDATGEDDSTKSDNDLRSSLLRLTLEGSGDVSKESYVSEYGWTKSAVVAAAADMVADNNNNVSSIAIAGLVHPNDLIRTCMDDWNRKLQSELRQKETEEWDRGSDDATGGKSSSSRIDRIADALRRRLEYNTFPKRRWQEGMALGAHPDNALYTQQYLQQLIDIVAKGTTDFNGDGNESPLTETQKLALGGVYVATELHWVASPDGVNHEQTWKFLRERLEEWDQFCKIMKGNAPFALPINAPDTLFVASSVASAICSGAISVLMPSSGTSTGKPSFPSLTDLPEPLQPHAAAAATAVEGMLQQVGAPPPPDVEHVWNSIFGDDDDVSSKNGNDGTHPSHYEKKSSPR